MDGATFICCKFGLLWIGSGLLNTRGGCAAVGGCSGCNTETSSVGLVCGVGAGCCCGTGVGVAGFSSIACGVGGACDACDSSDALGPLLLRVGGSADGSLGSAGLRGFLGFFSTTALGSLGFGFGPGFLRGFPAAVNLGVVCCGAGVGVAATPTLPSGPRIVGVFPLFCSGECGGELRLPGDDATSTDSIAARREKIPETPTQQRRCRASRKTTSRKIVNKPKGVYQGYRRAVVCSLPREVEAACWLVDSTPEMAADGPPRRVVENTKVEVHAGCRGVEVF